MRLVPLYPRPSAALRLREEDSVALRSDLRIGALRGSAGLRYEAKPEFGARKPSGGTGRCECAAQRRRVLRPHRPLPEPSFFCGPVASHLTTKLTVDGTKKGPADSKVSMRGTSFATTTARLPSRLMWKAPWGSSTVQKSPDGGMPPL
jgi:hypothetical protein